MVMTSGGVMVFFGFVFLIVTINKSLNCLTTGLAKNQISSSVLETSELVSSASLVGGH